MAPIEVCYLLAVFAAATELIILRLSVRQQSANHMLFFSALLLASCGYFALSISETVEEAVLATKLTYISTFLPLFVFFTIAEFCKTRVPRFLSYALTGATILDMGLACSIGYSPVFYRGYSLESWNDTAYLLKDYGPLHIIHYILLIVEIALAFLVIFRTLSVKRNVSRRSVFFLLVGLLLTVLVYILERMLQTPFDVIPILYVFFGAIYLGIAIRLQTYDASQAMVTEYEKNQEIGFVFFDKRLRLMNYNDTAVVFFPELSGEQIGQRIYTHKPLTVYITSWIEEIYREKMELPQRKNISHGEFELKCKVDAVEGIGGAKGYVVRLIDDTKQQEFIQRIYEEKERADEANKGKSDFLSNMSHELRTPMNVIVGMTDVLLREKQTPQNKEYLLSIKNSSHAMIALLDDILDFSNVELGKMELVEGEYDLLELLSDLGMFFLTRIDVKDVELLYDIDPRLPAKLYGDATRIRQIIINLMNNAIKYTNHGKIWLKAELLAMEGEDINIRFSVKDTGIGIHREDQRKLFNAFQQVDDRRIREHSGAGLGLALTKGLVQLMGGEISLRSKYGEGSEFFFNIHQRVLERESMAVLKTETPEQLTVAGMIDTPEVLEGLMELCRSYGLNYRTCGELGHGETLPDVLFAEMSGYRNIPDEKKAMLKEKGTTVCIIRNPIMEAVTERERSDAVVLNKPLFSRNFCLVVNHEYDEGESEEGELMQYKLPDAKVLVVDDTEINLLVVKMLLEPLEMEIDTAMNGREALSLIARKRYDLVFMDHMMPVMNGVEATKALRAMDDPYCRELPVIALTANVITDARLQYKAAGMNDMLAKPVTSSAIRKCLFKWMPKDLIIRTGEREVPKSEEETLLPDKIGDLDIEAGVENSGGKRAFLRLLGDFYQIIDTKARKIEECIENEMIKDYTIEVHAMKNSARLIGALELSDLFLACEKAGHEENREKIRELTPEALRRFRGLKEVLAPYNEAENAEKNEISEEKFKDILARIHRAMDSFDLDRADAEMKELETVRIPDNLKTDYEELRVAISDVAIEDVLIVTDRMLEKLS